MPVQATLTFSYWSAKGEKLGMATVFSITPDAICDAARSESRREPLWSRDCNNNSVVIAVDILLGWTTYPTYPLKAAPNVKISGVVPLLCTISK